MNVIQQNILLFCLKEQGNRLLQGQSLRSQFSQSITGNTTTAYLIFFLLTPPVHVFSGCCGWKRPFPSPAMRTSAPLCPRPVHWGWGGEGEQLLAVGCLRSLVQSLPKVGTGPLYSYLHATLMWLPFPTEVFCFLITEGFTATHNQELSSCFYGKRCR